MEINEKIVKEHNMKCIQEKSCVGCCGYNTSLHLRFLKKINRKGKEKQYQS